MRGSIEAESNLEHRLHLVGALGFEKPNSGITTVLQASLIPAPAGSGLPDNAQLNLFFVGSMEPLSQSFADDMSSLASQVEEEWAGLEPLEKRREDWEQALLARGTVARTPLEQRMMLAEMEQILVEREDHTARLAADLADYLESRRRAYAILNRAPARTICTGRWTRRCCSRPATGCWRGCRACPSRSGARAGAADRAQGADRDAAARGRGAGGQRAGRRGSGGAPPEPDHAGGSSGSSETERIRRYLAARDQLHAEGVRILTAMGRAESSIRQWDTLGALVRTRIARLAISAPP